MKKRILSMTLMALSFVAFVAMAQNPDNNVEPQQKQEQLRGKKQSKGDRKAKSEKMDKQRFNPFEGMNLSESQQSQLNSLKEQRKAERQQMAQTRKAEKQLADSTKRADRKAKMMARKQNRKEYLEQIKAIVGPENYVIFLENMVVNENPRQNGKSFHKDMKKNESRQHAGKGSMNKQGRKSQQREVRIPAEKVSNS